MGVALFIDTTLKRTWCLSSNQNSPDRRHRLSNMLNSLHSIINDDNYNPKFIVCENPLLRGKANNTMQRLLGAIESTVSEDISIKFIHPKTVKKAVLKGDAEKDELADAVLKALRTPKEKQLTTRLIKQKSWDETDAIAIGLAYLRTKDDSPETE